MKKISLLLLIVFIISCNSNAQKTKLDTEQNKYKVSKSEAEWKSILTKEQFAVLRKSGTEKPFSSKLNNIKEAGTFVCAACKTELYQTKHKFDSGTGWPSFYKGINENLEFSVDYELNYARTELKCKTCGGHLGHLFNDGPKPTGKRHCINGVALEFIPKN